MKTDFADSHELSTELLRAIRLHSSDNPRGEETARLRQGLQRLLVERELLDRQYRFLRELCKFDPDAFARIKSATPSADRMRLLSEKGIAALSDEEVLTLAARSDLLYQAYDEIDELLPEAWLPVMEAAVDGSPPAPSPSKKAAVKITKPAEPAARSDRFRVGFPWVIAAAILFGMLGWFAHPEGQQAQLALTEARLPLSEIPDPVPTTSDESIGPVPLFSLEESPAAAINPGHPSDDAIASTVALAPGEELIDFDSVPDPGTDDLLENSQPIQHLEYLDHPMNDPLIAEHLKTIRADRVLAFNDIPEPVQSPADPDEPAAFLPPNPVLD